MTRARDVANIDGLLTTTGDTYYASAAGTPARLGVGTTGQVLTVASGLPSWATPAGGASGLTLIRRASFSNVATTTTSFDTVFSSTYKTYLVVVETVAAATNGDDFQFQLRNGSTTIATDYYGLATLSQHNSTSFTFQGSSGAAEMTLSQNTTGGTNFSFWVNNVGGTTSSASWHGTGTGMNLPQNIQLGGGLYLSVNVTGILFKSSSSNITGTVAIYGLATS